MKRRGILLAALFAATVLFATACGDTAPGADVDVTLSIAQDELTLKVGESAALSVDTGGYGGSIDWACDCDVVRVDASGKVTALKKGSAVVSATAGRSSDYVSVTVTEEGAVRLDDEIKESGFLYHEDFSGRDEVPGYLRKSVSGGGSISLTPGVGMTLRADGAGMAFASHTFENALSGRIVAETKVKVASTAFSNILFFYRGEAGYDNGDIIACLGMNGGAFTNHNGSGWSGSIFGYTVNTWYEVKMVLDIGSGKYSLFINGRQFADQSFRKRGDGVEDRIKMLKFGTDKADGALTYEYIKIYSDNAPTVKADNDLIRLSLAESKTVVLDYTVSGAPKPTVTVTSSSPSATVGEDKRTVTFADDALPGTYVFTVRAENENGAREKDITVVVTADSSVLLDTEFDALPAGMELNSSNGSAEVENGTLVLGTNSSGSCLASARYDLGENLSGKVEVEFGITVRSSAFLNIFFTYTAGTTSIDAGRCTTSLAVEGNTLKYHDGGGWRSISASGAFGNNVMHEMKIVYDFDTHTMDVFFDGAEVLSGGNMRRASSETRVVIVGSDKNTASMVYDYMRIRKIGEEE